MVGQRARRRTLATLAGACGVLFWALETALVTFAGDVPPLQIVALAFAAVAVFSPLVWRVQGLRAADVLRQPLGAWVLNVLALLVFHTCLYHAVQNAPPAGAALMHGFTPLAIVVSSAAVGKCGDLSRSAGRQGQPALAGGPRATRANRA